MAWIGRNELVVCAATTLEQKVAIECTPKPRNLFIPPASVVYSPDGTHIVSAGFGEGVIVWDAATLGKEQSLRDSEGATVADFVWHGEALVAGGQKSALRIWDHNTGVPLITLLDRPSGVLSLAVSPDQAWLATGTAAGKVDLWCLLTHEQVASLDAGPGPIISVAFSPTSDRLATSAGGTSIRLWRAETVSEEACIVDPEHPTAGYRTAKGVTTGLAIVVFVGGLLGGHATVAPSFDIGPHAWPQMNCPLTFSPAGDLLAVTRYSPELLSTYQAEIYDVATGNLLGRKHGISSALAFSPDGTRLAASGWIRVVLLDPRTGEKLKPAPDE